MKVSVMSKKSGLGWTYGGNNIIYQKSNLTQEINFLNSK